MTLPGLDEPAGKWGYGVLLALAAGVLVAAVTVPMTLYQQAGFAVGVFLSAVVIHRLDPSRRGTVAVVIISALMSTRYLYWRATQTLVFENPLALVLGAGLFVAEVYAWAILLLGYFQCVWPLPRPIKQIRGPAESWPTVDIYIPTLNESLDIVQDTVLAALSIDYPPDRLRVYILDDGRRPQFAAFARRVGCGYITRTDNKGAKAGNLNHAMRQTQGELICVFDADHIATRAFLQMTVGWFQADPELALVQTPHFFYSPDPVQRNVTTVRDIQGEGELFYGVVQEGNDFWNAAFFCGSAAILRRSALDSIGGFTQDTVTEDAHTSLVLQRRGWHTAYLNIRLSAGLATERLALHIGQRARWARGMTQVFRLDNPLLGPGLTPWQRLCYLNAMLHFQFPLPRVVFLTAPLCYLLLNQNIIHASPIMILAFAGPHLLFAHMGNNRVQGQYNRSIWNEVYETILCFHLVRPTLAPLINPKAGRFNVTAKGGLVERPYFDWTSLRPHLIVSLLLLVGIGYGLARLQQGAADAHTVTLNIFWSVYNLLILLTALVVGHEKRQVRVNPRARVRLPASLHFDDGHVLQTHTRDISMGGAGLELPSGWALQGRRPTHLEIRMAERAFVFPVAPVRAAQDLISVQFENLNLENRRLLVLVVFGRADAWPSSADAPPLSASKAFADMVRANLSLLPGVAQALTRRAGNAPAARRPRGRPPLRRAAGWLLAVTGAAALAFSPPARAQAPATPPASQQQLSTAGAPGAIAAPGAAPVIAPGSSPEISASGVRQVSLSLKDLGVDQPLLLQTVKGEAGIPYNLRADEVVTKATLTLNFAYSPALLPDLSHLAILVNGEVVGTVDLIREAAGGVTVTIPIDPSLFTPRNSINFRFIGHYTRDCEDPLHSSLWANISHTRTRLDLTLQRVATRYDLARLPAPFFDSADARPLRLPFVFLENPTNRMLAAAGALSGYFGQNASYRGFSFPVSYYDIPAGDAVLIARAGVVPPGLSLGAFTGPTIALMANPRDPFSTLLVVGGRTDEEVLQAARSLAAAPSAFSGPRALVSPITFASRRPYDAPRWLSTHRPARIGDFVRPEQLEGYGLRPGQITTGLRVPPDLFFWPRKGPILDLGYRYPAVGWLDYRVSRLDVTFNGKYLKSLPLPPPSASQPLRDLLSAPVGRRLGSVELPAYSLFGVNELQFYFDLQVMKTGRCQGEIPDNVRVGIDADSKIDLTRAHHFARLPDLSFFASAGFPYTRMADLSETLVLVPAQPSPVETQAFLEMMGRMADSTGLPGVAVTVARPTDSPALAGRDVLVIGSPAFLASVPELLRGAPLLVDEAQLRVRSARPLDRIFALFGSNVMRQQREQVEELLVRGSEPAGVMAWRSPADPKRVVTAVFAASPDKLSTLLTRLADTETNYLVQGDVALVGGEGFNSTRVNPGFWSGDLPPHVRILWWLSENPILLGVMAVLASLLIGGGAYGFLKARERRRLREMAGR